MDRLSALTLVAIVLAGCEGDGKPGEPTSRVNAAKVEPRQGATTVAFCDVHATAAAAKAFPAPALAGAAPPAGKGWRWVNVWATWCKPCVEELPRLVRWRDKLAAAGRPIELSFVSVDETDEDIAAFRKLHPEVPASPRIADATKQAAWFAALGLDAAAPIPIHVFVDPAGRTRCVRAGGVREQDYAVVERLLAE